MKIECIKNRWNSRLLTDYKKPEHQIHSFFSYHPYDPESYVQRAKDVRQSKDKRLDRQRLIEVITQYHQPELMNEAVRRNLKRLSDPEALVVIGGQQAGLLTGPLYTLHKIFSILELAREQEEKLGKPVIPVFWIAGEDHDLDEVNQLHVRNRNGIQKHQFPILLDGPNKKPVSDLSMDQEQMSQWLIELSQLYPDSEFKKEWLEICLGFIVDSPSWGRFFARLLFHLFGEKGLLLIDSADPQVRQVESNFFVRLIEQNEVIQQEVKESLEKLVELGYPSPLDLSTNQANLFLLVEGERYLLERDGQDWITKDRSLRLSTADLLEIAKSEPQRLSNNVVTRPMMQEYLFPTLAFVAGPGEVAYWSVLNKAFKAVGLPMPIVYPRHQFTLLERSSVKYKEEFGYPWERLIVEGKQLKQEWLEEQFQFDLDQQFQMLKEKIEALYQPFIQETYDQVGRQTKEMGYKNLSKITQQVDFYQSFVRRTMEQIYEKDLNRWDQIIDGLTPLDSPQERVYNLISYWNSYGLDWMKCIPSLIEGQSSTDSYLIYL